MADEPKGHGAIGNDPNTSTGFGAGRAGSRIGFGSLSESRSGPFTAGGDVAASGFERSETGTRSDLGNEADTAAADNRNFADPRESSTRPADPGGSSGRGRIADQLQRVGDRIEERARHLEEAGGVQRKAGRVALRAGEALDSGADYIRTHEINEMRDDLESAIRERPLLSVGIAVGAGFLLARLMRD